MPAEERSEAPEILEIKFGGPEYREALSRRDRVLRRPLGMVLRPEDTLGEEVQRHFVLRESCEILAGVIAVDVGEGVIRLRQMWVSDEVAGSGRGRALLRGVECILKNEGATGITLHARLAIRGFYEKCGFAAEGELFEEVGIPHIRMTRHISPD